MNSKKKGENIVSRLVLAEKPSVGRDFARALGCTKKSDGYFEGPSTIVTWTIGHLLEAAPPEYYGPELKKWNFDNLPILPNQFKFLPIKKTANQLNVITKLIKRKDVEAVVIATDAGREGELIARLVLMHANCKKPLYRFWTSQALTKEIIVYGVNKGLKSAADFDRIFYAGYQRTMADWLIGMNLSRSASIIINNGVYSVGRVQTAVLAFLYDRKIHRDNFKPEPYWIFKVHFFNEKGRWIGVWFKEEGTERINHFKKKEDARNTAIKVKGAGVGVVTKLKKQKKKTPPPQLYSLTLLQRDVNKTFGLTAQQTLNIAQQLYEKYQAISYPRTDSQVLGSQNVNMVQSLVTKLSAHYSDIFQNIQSNLISTSNKRVFNDAKLTDHHALIPLKPASSNFSDNERRIYDMIMIRFAAVFHPDYKYEATEVITEVGGETFLTRGSITLEIGWRALYENGRSKNNEILPPLSKNDPVNVERLEGEEKQTQPLPDHTEASLLKDMSNPAKYVEDNELKAIYRGDIGLGTQATRAQIIETLLSRNYIKRNRKALIATEKGCSLINFLRQLSVSKVLSSPTETAKWEKVLNSIALGDAKPTDFETQIRQFVIDAVKEFKSDKAGNIASTVTVDSSAFGACPSCGGAIMETKKGYGCSNWRKKGCKFVIWKTIANKKLGKKDVINLLSGKTTREMKFKSKKGSDFKAALRLVNNKVEFDFGI